MKRKRNIAKNSKENSAQSTLQQNSVSSKFLEIIQKIMETVQISEAHHQNYVQKLQGIYLKMNHDVFMINFIRVIKVVLAAEENNECANITLLFFAKFIGLHGKEEEDTHPMVEEIFKMLLSITSLNPNIRLRICQFINYILNAYEPEASLDTNICDNILSYMRKYCLHDINSNVRVQAISALQRLQVPDNPDDAVIHVYKYHLKYDPSYRVREAVISNIGRNFNTIPCLIERLWDINEKVRRLTYLKLSSYPVKALKISDRLTILEQGLKDRSETVKKAVTNVLLKQWLESYQKNVVLLLQGLKLDSGETEIDLFRTVAKSTLLEIFKQKNEELFACIPLDTDGEYFRCVPHEKLTIEMTVCWLNLIEHQQLKQTDELDLLIPDLNTFCCYIEKFCEFKIIEPDQIERNEFQYILLGLMEILYTFDLADEIGRESIIRLIAGLLVKMELEEKNIQIIIKCTEKLFIDQNIRFQFIVELIEKICYINSNSISLILNQKSITKLLAESQNHELNLKLSTLKVKILDLVEQETNLIAVKDYGGAQRICDEKNVCIDEYEKLIEPLLENWTSLNDIHIRYSRVTSESTLKCLQVTFYMIVSENVKSLGPIVRSLYNNFICRNFASKQITIREWALKCGIACSMLYKALAKEVYDELFLQFYIHEIDRIWITSITGIFELLVRYGCSHFLNEERTEKSKIEERLSCSIQESLDIENEKIDILHVMSRFLDDCKKICIKKAVVAGFCQLILHRLNNSEIMEKLLLCYFNPRTDQEINQILGVFFTNIIQQKKQKYLQSSILPTISTVLAAPYESPLHEIKPDTIIRFMLNATQTKHCATGLNIHNELAVCFTQEMQNNLNNKELCRILAKSLTMLEVAVTHNCAVKNDLKERCEKLIQNDFDSKTLKHITDFMNMLDGGFNSISSSNRKRSITASDATLNKTTNTTAHEYSQQMSLSKNPAMGSIANSSTIRNMVDRNDCLTNLSNNGESDAGSLSTSERDIAATDTENINSTNERIPISKYK